MSFDTVWQTTLKCLLPLCKYRYTMPSLCVCVCAVSYTHLDVYKRQNQYCMGYVFLPCEIGVTWIFCVVLVILRSLISVSVRLPTTVRAPVAFVLCDTRFRTIHPVRHVLDIYYHTIPFSWLCLHFCVAAEIFFTVNRSQLHYLTPVLCQCRLK